MAIWIIGFPLVIFFILRKNKKWLGEKEMIITYGTFYIGLEDRAYYWELIIINSRKVTLSLIAITLSTQKEMYAALLVALILITNV